MKAVIELDVPEWQIGQNVTVFFPDTMQKTGVCELLKEQEAVVRCKDCKQGEQSVLPNRHLWCRIHEFYREPEWYCADGERKDDDGGY